MKKAQIFKVSDIHYTPQAFDGTFFIVIYVVRLNKRTVLQDFLEWVEWKEENYDTTIQQIIETSCSTIIKI